MIKFNAFVHPVNALRRWWTRTESATADSQRLSLALQGGGAHGAYTWGVLDALLGQGTLQFDAVSGSSAGAVNAVLLAQGWMNGERDGARKVLAEFWQNVGRNIPWPMVTQGNGENIELTSTASMLSHWMGLFPPGDLNPMDINPLRDMLVALIDFDSLRKKCPFRLYVAATHVNTGKLRLFREHELTVDMLLASACLPRIHHTVVIDGEPYWDGGFSANPAVFPLLDPRLCQDILLVLLAPPVYEKTPESIKDILTRMQEIGFTAHFLREMGWYAAQRQSIARAVPGAAGAELPRFHVIEANLGVMQRSDTKLLAFPPFLELLREHGQTQASAWLQRHMASIGRNSTMDWSLWHDVNA